MPDAKDNVSLAPLIRGIKHLRVMEDLIKGGRLKFAAGQAFESWAKEVLKLSKNTTCFKAGVEKRKKGCFIPDFLTRGGAVIEVKTTFGAVKKKQFQEFVQIAQTGNPKAVTYLFEKKPNAAEIAKMEKWAREAVGDNEIMLNIMHIFN